MKNHQKKIHNLKKIIDENNINSSPKFSESKKILIFFLKEMRNKEKFIFLNEILLRSQTKAYYHEKNKGHFGLSLNDYVHFTSPIRRYSDLVVHRNLISAHFKREKIKVLLFQII